jgi:hypothetical protein
MLMGNFTQAFSPVRSSKKGVVSHLWALRLRDLARLLTGFIVVLAAGIYMQYRSISGIDFLASILASEAILAASLRSASFWSGTLMLD